MSIFPDRESSSDVEVDHSTRQFQTILASNELRRERSINERILGVKHGHSPRIDEFCKGQGYLIWRFYKCPFLIFPYFFA